MPSAFFMFMTSLLNHEFILKHARLEGSEKLDYSRFLRHDGFRIASSFP